MFGTPIIGQRVSYKERDATIAHVYTPLQSGGYLVGLHYDKPITLDGILTRYEDVESCHLRSLEEEHRAALLAYQSG